MSIIVEKQDRVVCIQLNRPEVLNAINAQMMRELVQTITELDQQDDVGCFLIQGAGKAFCAGADIKELEQKTADDMIREDYFSQWEALMDCHTPKIAAVHGHALGGGCELAMMCDVIYAADNAVFGQPEIKLGVIPGMGGSQRLPRLVGRSLAMDMILTGRMLSGTEAVQAGMVARTFTAATLLSETLAIAHTIAGFSKTAAQAACQAVNQVDQLTLGQGLRFERRHYHNLWNTEDQTIGMQAFLQKKTAVFNRAT